MDGTQDDELDGCECETVEGVGAAEDVVDERPGQEVVHPPARVACLARHAHVGLPVPQQARVGQLHVEDTTMSWRLEDDVLGAKLIITIIITLLSRLNHQKSELRCASKRKCSALSK